jgi:hypothetical protein
MMTAMNGSEMYVMHQSVLQTAKNKYIVQIHKTGLQRVKVGLLNDHAGKRSHR